jgi:hypothetical protein
MTAAALEDLGKRDFEYIITLSANRNSSAANRKMGWRNVDYFETAYRHKAKGLDYEKSQSVIRKMLRRAPFMPVMYRQIRNYVNRESKPSQRQIPPFYNLIKTMLGKGSIILSP